MRMSRLQGAAGRGARLQLAAATALGGLMGGAAQAQTQNPNIICIVSDDTGYGDLGPYGGGEGRGMATPNIDRLAAEGMTNGGIATSLYISMKTVESHLARAYRKLGVKSRAELAGLFGLDPRLDVERASDPSA